MKIIRPMLNPEYVRLKNEEAKAGIFVIDDPVVLVNEMGYSIEQAQEMLKDRPPRLISVVTEE